MVTRAPTTSRVAAAPNRTTGETVKIKALTQYIFGWEGKGWKGEIFKDEMRAKGITEVNAILHKQGLSTTKSKRRRVAHGKKITPKDIACFTRQLSTMLKAGVPLLQSIDIIAEGRTNPSFTQLLTEVHVDIESGGSVMRAFRRHPKYFDTLYYNLIDADEQGDILDALLERLSLYIEKSLALKAQIKSALIYPVSALTVAFLATVVLMIFVTPSFKGVFSGFGTDLSAPTLFVTAISGFFVKWWIPIVLGPITGITLFSCASRRSENVQRLARRFILKIPIFDDIIRKAIIAHWTHTLIIIFAAGMPPVESMGPVVGTAGNWIYRDAIFGVQRVVCISTSLTNATQATHVFDNIVLQMTQIGEESDALDNMLLKMTEFYEREVGNAVANIPIPVKPIIIVFLGVLIGDMVVAIYLPIFKLGTVV